MTSDKKIYLILISTLSAALLFCLFIPLEYPRWLAAGVLALFAALFFALIKKRAVFSINKRQILLIMSVTGLLYLVLIYILGLRFNFYRSVGLGDGSFITHILPISIIIISTEIIRIIILGIQNKIGSVISYIVGVIADVLILSNFPAIYGFNTFMNLFAETLLPAITANVLYNYAARRYGMLPNISYRLIITAVPFLIPFSPDIPEALLTFIKLVLPLLIYVFISALFEKKKDIKTVKSKRISYVSVGAIIILMLSVVMLISGHFKYSALVIATESMTGEIDKGDTVIYEEYDGRPLKEQQVIVFSKDDKIVVHRIVKIEYINSQTQYYTKGDANDSEDSGFRTSEDILGVVSLKIPFIGYPSLWLRQLFDQ